MKTLVGALKAITLLTVLAATQAHAVPVLKLDCRIDDTVLSSDGRTVSIASGNKTVVDCSSFSSCNKGIYSVELSYNESYEQVTVSVTDSRTKRNLVSTHMLPAGKVGGISTGFQVGLSDDYSNSEETVARDKAGAFLSISCSRMN